MTYLVERLVDLRRYLDHLTKLRPRVAGSESLRADLSLYNDVLHSLFTISQLVIDLASDLAARRGARFETYAEAIRTFGDYGLLPAETIGELTKLADFRNIVAHDYILLDLDRVVAALDRLEPVEAFFEAVRQLEAGA